MKWKNLINELVGGNQSAKPNPPATAQQIAEIERKFNIELPEDIKNLLAEFNGDNWLIFSTSQIIETNERQRELDFYMPLDSLLFIAGNGCGDYYGYPISRADGVRENKIFLWEHENDSRICKASGLQDLIEKYYSDQI